MSLRETMEAAWEASESSDGGGADAVTESVPDSAAGGGDEGSGTGEGIGAAPDAGGEGIDSQPSGEAAGPDRAPGAAQRARDATGKFAKSATKATGKAVVPKLTQKAASPVGGTIPNAGEAAVTPAPAAIKPPQSWTPALREKFAGLPPEVQAEVDRRERETSKALQDAAPARQFAQELGQRLNEYLPMLKSFGNHPVEAIPAALQTIYQLHSGHPMARARAAAALIDQAGIDPDLINQAWGGTQPAQPQQSPQSFDPDAFTQQVEQRLMQRMQAQREQVMRQEVHGELESFAAANEFFADVRPYMAGIKAQNPQMDLKQVYEAACWAHPEVRKVVQQREAATQANARNASTQGKRLAAASSVGRDPASVTSKPMTVRQVMEAAWDKGL